MSVLAVHPEVEAALARSAPVVALESAITTHGLPFPDSLATARAMEAAVREEGAVPATIAIIDGIARVGLDAAELERLATDPAREKASVRDLVRLSAAGGIAGTTVAATLRIATQAGIGVMATGGLGGVHRGAETSFDISADLAELARSSLLVVASGIKAVLDVPKTMEVLETLGIPVFGWRTGRLPGFYVRELDHPLPAVEDEKALARVIAAHRAWGHPSALLLFQPPPAELALERAVFEECLARALQEARRKGVRGADETPFLLARIAQLAQQRTLALNRALVVANARLAARCARLLADLRLQGGAML